MEWFDLFYTERYVTRFQCGRIEPWLVWLHIAADLLVWSAYMAIPLALIYFVKKRKQAVPFPYIFFAFALFILSCGWSHFWDAAMAWWPAYRLWGFIKIITAIVSWLTALLLWRIFPLALSMRSPRDLERLVAERTRELQESNALLERKIRERDDALLRLKTAQEVTTRLMGSGIIAIITKNLDGKIINVNKAWTDLTGYETLEGLDWHNITPAEFIELEKTKLQETKEKGYCTPYEKEYIKPDGSRVAVRMAFSLFGNHGRGEAIGYVLDVGKEKRLEAELRRRIEELMDADLRKNEFVAMLAHELRNPLAPILTALPVMRKSVSEESAPVVARFCDLIERNVKNMSRIIDDLLDMSRINSGKVTLRNEIINFRAVIEHAVEAVRPLIQQKNHGCTINLPYDKVVVVGDTTRLEQVFTNVIQNAAKYTERGGQINITAKVDAGKVVTTVQDNGQGLAADIIPHIWDLFRQGDRGLDRSQGGLGLGLTIVKKLVALHGGSVEARSEGTGKGSEFTVILPTIEAALAQKAAEKSRGTMKVLNILIVDDNVDATESLAAYLEMSGHTIQIVHDGPDALAVCNDRTFDVILLDIGLPTINGYDVCRRLRESGNTAHIVAITGYGQEEDRAKSKEAGFNRHLVKPVDPANLEECLCDLVK